MKKLYAFLLLDILCSAACAQQAYFVDGYHGGIYGHYPLWNTQFYVDKLAEFPEWQISLEIEPETWDVAKRDTPEAYAAFQKIAADPRVEFVNPTLAQPYMYNISGESIIRQLEHGMDLIHKHFPDVVFTTYSVEEPCFTSSLPQILRSFGFKYGVLKCPNTCWGGYTAAYGGELVNWTGPDGTAILAVPRYAMESLAEEVWYTIGNDNSDEYLSACFAAGIEDPAGMCLQDAGWNGGPWIGTGQKVRNNSIYQTWRNYIENVTPGKTDDDWHFTQEDVLPGLMWGSQVLQKLAREVRASENNIIMAEKMNAMNFMTGGRPVDDSVLRRAWYSLALSQHHDSWIVPYNNLSRGKTWAGAISEWTADTDSLSRQVVAAALGGAPLNGTAPTPGTATGFAVNTIKVINTTSVPRREFVEALLPAEFARENVILTDCNGAVQSASKTVSEGETAVRFMADVPAFGYSVYRIGTAEKEAGSVMADACGYRYDEGGNLVVESDLYRLTFDLACGGVISSLVAKGMADREFVDVMSDFGFGELRGFFYEERRFRSSTENRATVGTVEKTPGSVTIEIRGEIAGHPYSQFVTLRRGDVKIDCSLRIDWRGNPGIGEFKAEDTWRTNRRPSYDDRYKLVMSLPAATGPQQVYKNAPFDVCESRLDDTFYPTWDSIKHNVALNWVDFMGTDGKYGLALFTDHTTSYTHGADFPAGLTVQYSGKGLWNRDYTITGPTEIRYALVPHSGTWDRAGLWTESVKWNEPLTVHACAGSPDDKGASLISLDRQSYEITTVEVKDGQLYVRLFNAESDEDPVKVNFGFDPRKVEEVQLDGKVIKTLDIVGGNGAAAAETSMPRFGLKTLRVSI